MIAKTLFFGDPKAKTQLVQLTGGDEEESLSSEFEKIRELSGRSEFGLTAVLGEDWNRDLSPWEAPPVFGSEGFGGGAQDTLDAVLENIVPQIRTQAGAEAKLLLGGYSLAGLFAVWAACQTDAFRGIASASGSLWFPGFLDFMKGHPLQVEAVYLSLGDKEEKTRNPVMRTVGDCVREAHAYLSENGMRTVLEWNPGNHFKEPDLRMAKGFAWLIKQTE